MGKENICKILTLDRLLHTLAESLIRKSPTSLQLENRRFGVRSSFSKNVCYSIIPPGKGHYSIIPTQNERCKKQGFLEHLLLPSSIYCSRKTSRVFILAKFLAFYWSKRLSIGYRPTSISSRRLHTPILTLTHTHDPHSKIVGGPGL